MTDTPRDDEQQIKADDQAFSDEHPLASPNELAGTADAGLELEFTAREIADAEGAASGIDYEEDTLPLEGN